MRGITSEVLLIALLLMMNGALAMAEIALGSSNERGDGFRRVLRNSLREELTQYEGQVCGATDHDSQADRLGVCTQAWHDLKR